MTPFPYHVQLDDSVRQARGLMVQHEVRHLPVLRNHELVGIITDRDIKRALDPDVGLPPRDELFVRDIYVPDPYVVDSSTPVDVVLDHMVRRHLGSALVTTRGRLAGILTSLDVCRSHRDHLRQLYAPTAGSGAA